MIPPPIPLRVRPTSSLAKPTTLVVAMLIATGSLPADAVNPADPLFVDLRFVPQEATESYEPAPTDAMRRQAVRIEFRDGRELDDPSWIGSGDTDDDRPFDVRSSGPVAPFVEKALRQSIAGWGLRIDPDAELVLSGTLQRFRSQESNKAVGSTYQADVRATFELREADGRVRWKGKARGDATRYGRKRSGDNVAEVLSDAAKRAFAALLDEPKLQASWAGESGATAVVAAYAPDDLLAELIELKERGLSSTVLVNFLRGKSLSRPLSAEDLVRWERSDLEPAVVDAARNLPVAP